MKIIERADYLESLQNVRLTPIGTETHRGGSG